MANTQSQSFQNGLQWWFEHASNMFGSQGPLCGMLKTNQQFAEDMLQSGQTFMSAMGVTSRRQQQLWQKACDQNVAAFQTFTQTTTNPQNTFQQWQAWCAQSFQNTQNATQELSQMQRKTFMDAQKNMNRAYLSAWNNWAEQFSNSTTLSGFNPTSWNNSSTTTQWAEWQKELWKKATQTQIQNDASYNKNWWATSWWKNTTSSKANGANGTYTNGVKAATSSKKAPSSTKRKTSKTKTTTARTSARTKTSPRASGRRTTTRTTRTVRPAARTR